MIADDQFDGEITQAFEFRPGRPRADVERALALVDLACEPATVGQVERWLAELALVTKARADHGDDAAARLAIIARDLREFPADVVRAAIKRRAQGYQFFPSLSELLMTCRLLGSRRLALREGLRRALGEAV